jgi:glycosyltransferase involved in cell wall biosynthesis
MRTRLFQRTTETGPESEPGATSDTRLTFVIYSSFPSYSGGRENWLFNVISRLDGKGHAITVYSCESEEPLFYDISGLKNVRVVRLPTLRRRAKSFSVANRLTLNCAFWLDAFVFVRRVYQRLLDDWSGGPVIAMNSVIDVLPALWFKKRCRQARVACSVRGRVAWELSMRSPGTGPFLPWGGPLLRWFEKRCLARCDLVLSNGYDTQEYIGRWGIPSVVVPNGVDIERFARGQTHLPEVEPLRQMKAAGKVIVIMVATLRGLKGVYELLEAARRLRETGQQFAVVFVGKGEQGRYRRKARSLCVEDRVWFAGEQRDVPAFLGLADVSVNLSRGAGMSMATLESMAAGKAILAWDTPVYRQLIQNGYSGVLAEEGDTEALAQELSRLIDTPALRESLGRAARAQAREYDWSAVARRFLEALEETEAIEGRDRG